MGTSGAQKIPMRPSSPAPSPGVPFCSTQPLTAASPGVSGLRGRLPSSPSQLPGCGLGTRSLGFQNR